MRLLEAQTLKMKEFVSSTRPRYAILSHTWGEEEVTFHDMQDDVSVAQHKKGYIKIQKLCEKVLKSGLEWAWIDTCCIDKTSSAELSEAINSMFAWYRDSFVCYAFLEDVPPMAPYLAPEKFNNARWFRRGWCLQELLAPTDVEFLASDWSDIGTRTSLRGQVESVTGIPEDLLLGYGSLSDYSGAEKLSWASSRQTAREEDEAYCLLGIFDINMYANLILHRRDKPSCKEVTADSKDRPVLYGEGRRAFLRLQEHILIRDADLSLLLWNKEAKNTVCYDVPALAVSPAQFPRDTAFSSGNIGYGRLSRAVSTENFNGEPPQITSRGIKVHVLAKSRNKDDVYESIEDEEPPQEFSNQLFIWTGIVAPGNAYMCLSLYPSTNYGRQSFARRRMMTGDGCKSSIHCISATDIYRYFKLETVYLRTEAEPRNLPPWMNCNCRHASYDHVDIQIRLVLHGSEITVFPETMAQGFHLGSGAHATSMSDGFKTYFRHGAIPASMSDDFVNLVAERDELLAGAELQFTTEENVAKDSTTVIVAADIVSHMVGIVQEHQLVPRASQVSTARILYNRDCRRLSSGNFLYLALHEDPINLDLENYHPSQHLWPQKGIYYLHVSLVRPTSDIKPASCT
jgi:hypothetical protein